VSEDFPGNSQECDGTVVGALKLRAFALVKCDNNSVLPISGHFSCRDRLRALLGTSVLYCDTAVVFARSIGFSAMADRMMRPSSLSCDRKVTTPTKST